MREDLTPCQEILLERYSGQIKSEEEKMIMLSVGMGAKEFGFETEIIEYLESHPRATLKELDSFAAAFFPEIVEED